MVTDETSVAPTVRIIMISSLLEQLSFESRYKSNIKDNRINKATMPKPIF